MVKISWYTIALGMLLVIGVFIAGCSSQPAATPTTTVPTTAAPLTKFVIGDIAAKTATSTDTFWLVLDYDKTTDQYVRALVFKNTDGSWGHRSNNMTEKTPRTTMEKVYPVKIAHVTISSIPIVTPTAPTTVPTTLSGYAPSISNVTPTSGAVGGTVTMTIAGSNFQNGATVKLVQSGFAPVTATGVSVSSNSISCTFSLGSLNKGYANIRVTNPDGQSSSLENVFNIGESPPTVATVSPISTGLNQTVLLTITGQNFKDAVNVKLTKDTTVITCTSPAVTGTTTIKCTISTSSGPTGDWTLTVKNLDGQMTGTLPQMFKITNSS